MPSPSRPNWFVGLPVPPQRWFAEKVPAPPPGIRRFHADDLHLTVAFLGPVAEDPARAAFAAIRWPLPALTVTLGPVVPMGRRYSALSALIEQGRAAVEAAIGCVRDAACLAAGAPCETRPPKAHVTVARPQRHATVAERAAGLRWAQQVELARVEFTLARVALYSWAEDRRERQFRIVDCRDLAPS
ncbi:MAG: hypothetical protein R3F56_01660 [Planctomycetota bacterium]